MHGQSIMIRCMAELLSLKPVDTASFSDQTDCSRRTGPSMNSNVSMLVGKACETNVGTVLSKQAIAVLYDLSDARTRNKQISAWQ